MPLGKQKITTLEDVNEQIRSLGSEIDDVQVENSNLEDLDPSLVNAVVNQAVRNHKINHPHEDEEDHPNDLVSFSDINQQNLQDINTKGNDFEKDYTIHKGHSHHHYSKEAQESHDSIFKQFQNDNNTSANNITKIEHYRKIKQIIKIKLPSK
ncbi:unnamed protein product [[Candida] boidinii]|nr:unnamed protein product [[Candida] boidinii]